MDLIERQKAIDALDCINGVEEILRALPSAQTDVARDIATIIENEKDMRVIKKNAEIIHCRDCKHKPTLDEDGELEFPTSRCPCHCDDDYYSWMPKDDWFCGNAERRTGETD